MLLIVGLGNPGPNYAGHRHNVGFMALEAIARRHGFSAWRKRFQGQVAEGQLGSEKVIALEPMTYMNNSGQAVGEALRFFKLPPEAVLVFHDELDLAPGKIKAKRGGGHAGHNGLRSITQHIGPDFRRLRIGIGHPGDKSQVHSHVLNDLSKGEQPHFERLFEAMAEHAALLAEDSEQADNAFTSKVMQALLGERPKKAAQPAPIPPATSPPAPPQVSPQVPGGSGSKPDADEGVLARALRNVLGPLAGKTRRDE